MTEKEIDEVLERFNNLPPEARKKVWNEALKRLGQSLENRLINGESDLEPTGFLRSEDGKN